MTPEELKAEFSDLVNYYYDEMSECKTLSDLYKLNWHAKDKGINLMFKAFNETWEQGWDPIKGRKDSD
jgi:hypothetical protein